MADLKAAAGRLRERLNPSGAEYVMVRDERRAVAMLVEAQDNLLAAQALEALAWQAETGASVRKGSDGRFFCCGNKDDATSSYYYADTPLGAILAAMEGERNA